MGELKEMTERAAREASAAGVQLFPIVNYPIDWRI
jgi:hypothetical protein